MKIFITGSTGFIGKHLIERLSNHTLIPLTCDLRDYKNVEKQLVDSDPDIIIHLAARTEVEKSFYEQLSFSEINYLGTVNLVESARQCKNLRNFIFSSTMEVYGWQPISDYVKEGKKIERLPAFTEELTPNPNAPYAVAKYACEKYIEYAGRSYNLPYTMLRQTNTYGRKDNTFFVTEQIISQMLNNNQEINLGYSTPYRNFLYIDDLIDAYESLIYNTDKVVKQLYNLGPDNAIQICDYVQLIANKIGWNGTVNYNTKPIRHGEIYYLNSSNSKLTLHTGWYPKIDLSEGLDRTIAYYKKLYGKD